MKAYLDSIDTLSIVHVHSDVLRVLILAFIMNDGDRDSIFVFEDGGKDLPIPIYSSLTPQSAVAFILHIMLVCGSFETELDKDVIVARKLNCCKVNWNRDRRTFSPGVFKQVAVTCDK